MYLLSGKYQEEQEQKIVSLETACRVAQPKKRMRRRATSGSSLCCHKDPTHPSNAFIERANFYF